MKKHLIITALCCFVGLFFASCSNDNALVGTWVEPANEDGIVGEIGFTLLEDGGVEGINMGYSEFQSWEKVGKSIVLKGTYTGTNPHEFADTMNIVEVNKEHLVLEQAGYEITYLRR